MLNNMKAVQITLGDTAEMMNSKDYKERFKAEYLQTKIRYEKLKNFNTEIEAAGMSEAVKMPKHDCPDDLLRAQQSIIHGDPLPLSRDLKKRSVLCRE